MSTVAITGKAALATLAGVADMAHLEAARTSREAQEKYLTELVSAYRDIEYMARQVEGAKSVHGAYIYRNLEELSVKGRVTVADATGQVKDVALGEAVSTALGNVMPNGVVKPLSSGSASRYKWISRIYFDAGITEEDPDYADIVNYYVSDSRITALLKYREGQAPKDLTQKVRDAVAVIRTPAVEAPKVTVIEGESQGDENPSGSQGPESGAEVGGSAEGASTPGTDTSDNREPRPNGEATLSDNGARLERVLAELSAMTVPDADDCASLFSVRAIVSALLESAPEAVRLEGRATFERLSK